jgi:diguanylate cyclase (GGDEF)-like protein/PAS domain S-box-containing protein
MTWLNFLTIRTKLMLAAFLTAMVAITITSTASIYYDQKRAREALVSKLKVISEVVASRSTAALTFQDKHQAKKNLDALQAEADIEFACIYNIYNEVFVSRIFINKEKVCPPSPIQAGFSFKERFKMSQPIRVDQNIIGWLYIEATLGSLAERIKQYSLFNILIFFAGLIVAAIIARSLQQLVTGPLNHLGDTLSNIIQKNDYSLRAIKENEDELGKLVDIINSMLDKIEADNYSLKTSEDKFRQLTSLSPVGIFQADLHNQLIYVNSRWCEITGMSEERVSLEHWLDCLTSSDRRAFLRAWQQMTSQKEEMALEVSMEVGGVTQYLFCEASPVLDDQNILQGYLGVLLDISELKQAQIQMENLAQYDPLTGLANRRQFKDKLELAIRESMESEHPIAILFMDLDQFKRVNDSLGHDAGDQLLVAISKRLKHCVAHQDVIARIGGDEFTVLLKTIENPHDVHLLAERILSTLSKPIFIRDMEIICTLSMGITLAPNDGIDANDLMRNADVAMYRAKEKRRNNYQFFSSDMNLEVVESLSMERKLREAIDQYQFIVFFQSKIRLDVEQPCGAEALIRWRMATGEIISPYRFIPIAEQSGLIVSIGDIVFRKSCETLVRLLELGLWSNESRMAVNLSARQFEDPQLVSSIKRILKETGCPAHYLECEITESTLMENLQGSIEVMKSIKNLGLSLAIDDFGTGYSSLSYLKRLPIDTLKVDRSFVMDIPKDVSDMEISAAVIAMAHKLHLKVVAEGVETREQLSFLKANRCEYAQGFFFSKPLAELDFVNYLQENSSISKSNTES